MVFIVRHYVSAKVGYREQQRFDLVSELRVSSGSRSLRCQWRRSREPTKFWAVENLSKNLPFVRKFSSKNAKCRADNPHFLGGGKFGGEIEIFGILLEICSVCQQLRLLLCCYV